MNILTEFVYTRKKISLHFPITGGKNLALCRNFSSVFVRTASFVFIKTFWGKLFLLEKLGFLILLRSWAKNFGPSFKKFSAGYQNCILYFHRNNVMERIRFFFFLNFRHWEKIFLPFLGKIWRESQNCFLKVHTNFFEENILSWKNRFLDFFQNWVETFLIFVEFFQRRFQNCFLKVHTNFLRKMVFLELISVIINFRLEWKLAIRIFVEFFRRYYQNCFLQVHTNLSIESFLS